MQDYLLLLVAALIISGAILGVIGLISRTMNQIKSLRKKREVAK